MRTLFASRNPASQRQQAESLLPLIGQALEARRSKRTESLRGARRAALERQALLHRGMKEEANEFG